METKLILISLVLVFVPPVCLYFIGWRRRLITLVVLMAWLVGIFVGYPVITFAWAMGKIRQSFDHDCPEVIRLSKYYDKLPYFSLQSDLIAVLVGRTPKYYYLSNIAHCELKIGTIKASIGAYEDLRNYVAISDYDRQELPSIDRVLQQLRSGHHGGKGKSK